MRNPNGYGTVAKLSGSRRRPYIVKKTVGWRDNGQPVVEIIGYTTTREEGNMLLAEYNRNPWDVNMARITLGELFELWKVQKAPRLGKSNRDGLISAYRHCEGLSNIPYKEIKAYQMQATIDGCGRGSSTQSIIKNLWGHLDKFALEMDVVSRCYSSLLEKDPMPPTSRKVFTEDEIDRLWDNRDEPWVDTVLILLYSGWRISEFLGLTPNDVDLDAGTMRGGVKTEAGKNRIVPIHSAILELVQRRLSDGGSQLISNNGKPVNYNVYKNVWDNMMARFGMTHIPHECRHTFESRLDSAGANRKCIDLMMGHVSKDVGNRVYNHKTVDELRAALELLPAPRPKK